jgi:hypothetical protein
MLEDLIIELCEKANQRPPSVQEKNEIKQLLEENDLDSTENVPTWFSNFIKDILMQKEVPRSFFTYDSSKGDVDNFLAEMEDYLHAEWDDYGEAVEIFFPNLRMKVCISTEGNFYEAERV